MMFDLQGTDAQQELAAITLNARCDFPWDRLQPGLRRETGREQIPVEWADLSRYANSERTSVEQDDHDHLHVHDGDDTAHVLGSRSRVLGLAWYSGKISVEQTLAGDLAAEVLLAEAAHMVDFFYLDDRQRVGIWNALHPDHQHLPDDADIENAVDLGHGHGWFDVGPYGSWVGEAWMETFVRAFSDVPVTIRLGHPTDRDAAVKVRAAVLGEPQPYYGLEASGVYHDSHRGVRREVEWAQPPDGRRPCRVCRP